MPVEQRFLEPHEQGRAWSWSTRRADRADDRGQEPDRGRSGPDGGRSGSDGGRSGPDGGSGSGRFGGAEDQDAPVYVISVAADLAGLHPQTLRAYEREGLLTPARTEGGTRRYSQRDVDRLRFIRTLTQDEGLNLAGVRIVLDLGEKLEASRRRVSELEEMVRVLAERIEDRPGGGDRFEIVKAPPSQVEVHSLRRRTGQRGGPVQRARPIPPPEMRTADA